MRPHQHGELVAAQPRGHVVLAAQTLELARNRFQHAITGDVAEAVVDRLEVVQVDQQQTKHASARRMLDLIKMGVQAAPVAQAGQFIGLDQMLGIGQSGACLPQRIEREQQLLIAPLQIQDQLLLAVDQIGERAPHEVRDGAGLLLQQRVEITVGHRHQQTGATGDRTGEARMVADEESQFTEVLASADALVAHAVAELERDFAFDHHEHGATVFAAPEDQLAGGHHATLTDRLEQRELLHRQSTRIAARLIVKRRQFGVGRSWVHVLNRPAGVLLGAPPSLAASVLLSAPHERRHLTELTGFRRRPCEHFESLPRLRLQAHRG